MGAEAQLKAKKAELERTRKVLAEYADQERLESLDGLYAEEEYGSPWKPVSGLKAPLPMSSRSLSATEPGATPSSSTQITAPSCVVRTPRSVRPPGRIQPRWHNQRPESPRRPSCANSMASA